MKKGISYKKPDRDLRLSLCVYLLYVGGVAAGLFVPSVGLFLYAAIPTSYAIQQTRRSRRPCRRAMM
jgi:hypothetical protein